jgi:hypothetical protein
MGDHRASIKINIEFHDVKDEMEFWINYNPDGECWGIDDRIIDFIRDVYLRGMRKYEKEDAKETAKEIEKEERAELKRLKKIYEK